MLGALFHEYLGKNLTKTINDKLHSDITPYLVDAAVIGSASTGIFSAYQLYDRYSKDIKNENFDSNKFLITSIYLFLDSVIQGFLIGTAAGLGAYFGDETNDDITNFDSYDEIQPVFQ